MWERTVASNGVSGSSLTTFSYTSLTWLPKWTQWQRKSKSCFLTRMRKDGLCCAKGLDWCSVVMVQQFWQSWRTLMNGSSVWTRVHFLLKYVSRNTITNNFVRMVCLAATLTSQKLMDYWSQIVENALTVPRSWRCLSGLDAATTIKVVSTQIAATIIVILPKYSWRRKYLLYRSYAAWLSQQHVSLIAKINADTYDNFCCTISTK